jgi:hypothetical protein
MAIASVGNGGTGVSATSSTTLNVNAARDIQGTGQFAILVVSCDNTTTTDGVSNDVLSVSNDDGGTWSKLAEFTNGNGAAAAGVTTAAFLYIPGAGGEIRQGDPARITFASARVQKAASMWVFSKAANVPIVQNVAAITNGVDASNGFGSVAFTGLPSLARLYFRALGKEANSTTQITPSTSFTAITANRSSNTTAAILVRGEFRVVTATAQTSNPTLNVSGDTAGIFLALVEGTNATLPQNTRFNNTNTFFAATLTQSGGTTSLTQNARFDDGDTFFGPTVGRGPVNLTPALYTNPNNFFAATITQGGAAQSLTAGLYTNSSTFYAATLTAGAVSLAQNTRFDNGNTFNAATLTVGPVSLTQNTRFDNTSTFNSATLTVGPVNLAQNNRFDNTSVFNAATITVGATALSQNARFNNSSVFNPATLTVGPVTLTQNTRFDNTSVFNPATISFGAVTLTQNTRFDNSSVFNAATLTVGPVTLSQGTRLENVSTFYPATVSAGGTTLSQNTRLDNLSAFYTATLTVGAANLAQNTRLDNVSAFYAPTVSTGAVNLVQNLRLDNSQTFYAASITRTTVLSAGLITNAQTFYAASLTGTAFILPSLYTDGDTFFAATITLSNFSQTLTANTFVNGNTFFPASLSGGEQSANNGGVVIGPRIRPFKKTILWDFDKPEEKEEKIDAVTFVVTAIAKADVTKVTALGEINGEARIDYVQAKADVFAIEARSSWNDPTDEELISIISMAI